MAFQAPTIGRGQQNKRILEELEERKKRLRLQTSQMDHSSTNPSGICSPSSPTILNDNMNNESLNLMRQSQQMMTPAQRTALQHAHANSVGYFITQDSSFGNLILPVLPRLEK